MLGSRWYLAPRWTWEKQTNGLGKFFVFVFTSYFSSSSFFWNVNSIGLLVKLVNGALWWMLMLMLRLLLLLLLRNYRETNWTQTQNKQTNTNPHNQQWIQALCCISVIILREAYRRIMCEKHENIKSWESKLRSVLLLLLLLLLKWPMRTHMHYTLHHI